MKCTKCKAPAVVALPSHNAGFCPDCYLEFFSRQVAKGIKNGGYLSKTDPETGETVMTREPLFTHEDRVLVALSGGKDSLAMMLELSRQGYNVTGLHIDLSIGESSRLARRQVELFCDKHALELQVLDMAREGLPIPLVKEKLKRPICSACGKIKRHYFNKAALDGNYDAIATGHNLDDEISRLFSNVLRWDSSYLGEQGPLLPAEDGFARKVKPLWRLGEFETANYAYLMGIDWHTMPCPYSKGASFSTHKRIWADLEEAMPGKRLNFYLEFLEHGRKNFAQACRRAEESLAPCPGCGYPTSSELCGVCRIKDMLKED